MRSFLPLDVKGRIPYNQATQKAEASVESGHQDQEVLECHHSQEKSG